MRGDGSTTQLPLGQPGLDAALDPPQRLRALLVQAGQREIAHVDAAQTEKSVADEIAGVVPIKTKFERPARG